MKNAKSKERKIHVALPDEVHQKLRVKCALRNVTIQEYVASLIAEAVRDIVIDNRSTKTIARES